MIGIENIYVSIWRTACDACAAAWNLDTYSALALGSRKKNRKAWSILRFVGSSGCTWFLASSPTLYTRRYRSVVIATRLRAGRPRNRGSIPGLAIDISLLQNGSDAHPASYTTDAGGCFPEGKTAGAWNWPLTYIKCWSQEPSLAHTFSWRGA
jgi:hypothetical protein